MSQPNQAPASENTTPRAVLIGAGIALVVIGCLLCAGVGTLAFQFGAQQEATRRDLAALTDAKNKPVPEPLKDAKPQVKEPSAKEPEPKPVAEKKPVPVFDRAKLLGKWEPWREDPGLSLWEFKADGTGTAGILFFGGKMEWSMQGDVANIDMQGQRLQCRPQIEGDKLVLMLVPKEKGIFVLKRLTKEREAELDEGKVSSDQKARPVPYYYNPPWGWK